MRRNLLGPIADDVYKHCDTSVAYSAADRSLFSPIYHPRI